MIRTLDQYFNPLTHGGCRFHVSLMQNGDEKMQHTIGVLRSSSRAESFVKDNQGCFFFSNPNFCLFIYLFFFFFFCESDGTYSVRLTPKEPGDFKVRL